MPETPSPTSPTEGTPKTQHRCEQFPIDTERAAWGLAIYACYEGDDGQFWVENDEYANTVNFCPFCGERAPTPMTPRPKPSR